MGYIYIYNQSEGQVWIEWGCEEPGEIQNKCAIRSVTWKGSEGWPLRICYVRVHGEWDVDTPTKVFRSKHCRRQHPLSCKQFSTIMLVMFCEKRFSLDTCFQACWSAVIESIQWVLILVVDVVGVIVGVVVNIFRGWWVVLVGDLAVLQSMGKKRKCIMYIYIYIYILI